jgi:hypothetical protein
LSAFSRSPKNPWGFFNHGELYGQLPTEYQMNLENNATSTSSDEKPIETFKKAATIAFTMKPQEEIILDSMQNAPLKLKTGSIL